MKTRIADIKANPFRHMERYPIRQDKVKALRESLRTTGFWDNVVGRIGEHGGPEIAYGHHRLTALREEYSPNHQVNLIIRDLSDEDMLQIMARENMEEWGTSATVEHETVRAVVEAYGAGLIDLPAPPHDTPRNQLRYAPGFQPDVVRAEGQRPYTASAVADFLGWVRTSGRPQNKVHTALSALELIEDNVLTEDDFAGMSTKQAEALVTQTQQARRQREADAKAQQRQAEEARKRAEKAEQDRQRHEAEREDRERRAAQAKQERQRQEHELRAREAERQAHQADEQRKQAERQRKEAEAKAERERERGRKEAGKVGRAVGEGMRSGRVGYRQAGEEAAKHRSKNKNDIPDIDKFIDRLSTQIVRLLEPESKLAVELDAVIKHQTDASEHKIDELVRNLRIVEQRIVDYQTRLGAVISDAVAIAGELEAGQ